MPHVTIAFEDPTGPDLSALHDARLVFNSEGYDPKDVFTPPIAKLADPDMRFRVARVDGVAAGMGALRIDDGWGEVKSVFVDPAARGAGVARAIMDELERVARAEGLTRLRLETGHIHHDALALYPRLGWVEIPRFDPYPENDTSIFFEKVL